MTRQLPARDARPELPVKFTIGTMVTLTTVNWMHEADLLCAQLASHGIDAIVPDQNTAAVLPLHGAAIGGIRVQIHESELESARQVLRDMGIVKEGRKPRCPTCDSEDVKRRRESWLFFAMVVLLLGIPLLWLREKCTCRQCGRSWRGPHQ